MILYPGLGFWIDSLPRSRTGNLEKGFKRSNLSNLSMTFPMTWLMADALLMCVVESSSTLIEVISTSLKHGENSDKDDSLLNVRNVFASSAVLASLARLICLL